MRDGATRNWDHLEQADRGLFFAIGVFLIVLPAADAPFEMGHELGGSNAMWLGLVCGGLGGPALLWLAANIWKRRSPRSSPQAIAAVLALLHLPGFVLGAILAGVLSGFIAPCHGSGQLDAPVAMIWLGVVSVPTGVMLVGATRWWPLAATTVTGVLAAGWLASGSAGMVMWGVAAWSASVLIPLAVWMRRPAVHFPATAGHCICGYELGDLERCPECGRTVARGGGGG